MYIRTTSILAFNLLLATTSTLHLNDAWSDRERTTSATATCASVHSSDKNESTLSRSALVKKDLLKLFELCKSERYAEAAKYFVYRGREKNREWKDVCNYNNPDERTAVESSGGTIKALLAQSDSYTFSKYVEQTKREGRWHVWEMTFQKDSNRGTVYFALLKVKGRYAVGDINGHGDYLRY